MLACIQVVAANLDGGAMFAGPNIKPIGGNIMVGEGQTPCTYHQHHGRGAAYNIHISSTSW